MANAETETDVSAPAVAEQLREAENKHPAGQSSRELMAPGHLYNPRTGTGIEWLRPDSETGEPGRVRLWSRRWNGKAAVLAEAEHHAGSPWKYWYNLEFADSFPQVSHWWFGDAWTGIVRIWEPQAAGRDSESGAPMLSGWMRFGLADTAYTGKADADPASVDGAPALPWTVVLTNPPRVSIPQPPMCVSPVNLPLQFLLADRVMELLGMLVDRNGYQNGMLGDAFLDVEVALTSLVRREDLHRAFPTEFGPWRLDSLPGLTPREALCRVQGLAPEPQLP